MTTKQFWGENMNRRFFEILLEVFELCMMEIWTDIMNHQELVKFVLACIPESDL